MEQVLVVEDEFYARKSILKILRECGLDVQVCGEAANGKEAVEILEEKRNVDLVITDIKMDEMDGLELSEYISKNWEETDILILTAFENFEFARKAIQYRVSDYIVKPITKENLIPAVNRVLEQRRKRRREREERSRKISSETEKTYFPVKTILSHQKLLEDFFPYRMAHPGALYRVGVMQLEQKTEDSQAKEICRIIRERYRNAICDVFYSKINREFVLLLNEAAGAGERELEPKRAVQALRNYMQNCKNDSVTIGIGKAYVEEEKLYPSYTEAVYALNQRLISGWGNIYYYEEMVHTDSSISETEKEKLEWALQKGCAQGVKEAIHQLLSEIVKREESAQKLYMTVVEILKFLGNYYTERYRENEEDNFGDVRIIFSRRHDLYRFQYMEELENYLDEIAERLCRKEEAKTKNSIVAEILEYINQNYYRNISLRELAENKYFVNYSYLSRIFGQETGMTFSKYLIQLRLKKAEEFLQDDEMKISSIAFEVGYNDVSHFIQSFKKVYGMTPEEFRGGAENRGKKQAAKNKI